MDQAISHKKRRFCHVSSVEEEPGIGGGRRGRWFSFGMKKEQANYQKTQARAATRMGGRSKQIHAESQAKVEE